MLGAVAHVGPGRSLVAKVKLAQVYFAAADLQATCVVLADFDREVAAQSSKPIAWSQAQMLAADADAIARAIECR